MPIVQDNMRIDHRSFAKYESNTFGIVWLCLNVDVLAMNLAKEYRILISTLLKLMQLGVLSLSLANALLQSSVMILIRFNVICYQWFNLLKFQLIAHYTVRIIVE